MDENGQFGGKKVYEYLMDSGEYVYVQPLSIFALRGLREKAEELFPFPEKAKYERPLDADKAIEPGQMIPAEDNPEYRSAYDAAEEQQSRYVNDRCIALSVEPVIGREAIVTKYQERRNQMREMMDLPDDEWDATLRFCVISSPQDYAKISRAIQGKALPSEEDIRDGMRIFRCYLRESIADRHHRQSEPQSADADNPTATQLGDGTL